MSYLQAQQRLLMKAIEAAEHELALVQFRMWTVAYDRQRARYDAMFDAAEYSEAAV